MKTLLDKKIIFMDEYYVLHLYKVKFTIKYYLVKKFIYNMYT